MFLCLFSVFNLWLTLSLKSQNAVGFEESIFLQSLEQEFWDLAYQAASLDVSNRLNSVRLWKLANYCQWIFKKKYKDIPEDAEAGSLQQKA